MNTFNNPPMGYSTVRNSQLYKSPTKNLIIRNSTVRNGSVRNSPVRNGSVRNSQARNSQDGNSSAKNSVAHNTVVRGYLIDNYINNNKLNTKYSLNSKDKRVCRNVGSIEIPLDCENKYHVTMVYAIDKRQEILEATQKFLISNGYVDRDGNVTCKFSAREKWGRHSYYVKGEMDEMIEKLRKHLNKLGYSNCLSLRPSHVDTKGKLIDFPEQISFNINNF